MENLEEFKARCNEERHLPLIVEKGPIGMNVCPSYETLEIESFDEWEALPEEEKSKRLEKVW